MLHRHHTFSGDIKYRGNQLCKCQSKDHTSIGDRSTEAISYANVKVNITPPLVTRSTEAISCANVKVKITPPLVTEVQRQSVVQMSK